MAHQDSKELEKAIRFIRTECGAFNITPVMSEVHGNIRYEMTYIWKNYSGVPTRDELVIFFDIVSEATFRFPSVSVGIVSDARHLVYDFLPEFRSHLDYFEALVKGDEE